MSIANELITRGWTQGTFRAEDGAVCIRGALLCSVAPAWLDGELVSKTDVAEIHRREDILWKILDRRDPAAWNDTPGRTFDEVLRVAKEADELLGAA